MKPKVTPIQQEREFYLHELFFSTTDKKGIITSGNDVFARVSGYDLADLLGQPHNIVRHPDMPRAVFKLLWDYLKADNSIVAYVKNLASDGRYYWVVALVTPLNTGYLSIRFKPSSDYFPVVRELYQQLVTLENNLIRAGKNPKDGIQIAAEKLQDVLQTKGFENYDAFMHLILREELKSRERLLQQAAASVPEKKIRSSQVNQEESIKRLACIAEQSDQISQTLTQLFSKLDDFVLLGGKLESKVGFISDLAQGMRILSLNTGIASSRLKVENDVLTSIANLMGENSETLNVNVHRMGERLIKVSTILKTVVYDLAAARLQLEMLQTFLSELIIKHSSQEHRTTTADNSIVTRILTLQNTFMQTYKRAIALFQQIESDLQSLTRDGVELQRSVQTLQFVHLVGRVEVSRQTHLAGFGKIMEEVFGKIQDTRGQLEDMFDAVAYLFQDVYRLGQIDRRVSESLQLMQKDARLLEAEMR